MTLQTFFPERFIRAGSFIYKVKMRSSSCSGEMMGGNCFDQELEEIIRTVLGNLDRLQPFSSAHFNVFPYKKQWEGVSNVLCQHYERKLRVYPFILHLYLERNAQNAIEKRSAEQLSPQTDAAERIPSELQSKRRKRQSTLEDAVLKDMMSELEADRKVSVGLHMDLNPAEEAEEDSRRADEKSGVTMLRGSGIQGEVHAGTRQDEDEEDEEDEEEDNAESAKPGILTRLVSSVFPFSWFFREP